MFTINVVLAIFELISLVDSMTNKNYYKYKDTDYIKHTNLNNKQTLINHLEKLDLMDLFEIELFNDLIKETDQKINNIKRILVNVISDKVRIIV